MNFQLAHQSREVSTLTNLSIVVHINPVLVSKSPSWILANTSIVLTLYGYEFSETMECVFDFGIKTLATVHSSTILTCPTPTTVWSGVSVIKSSKYGSDAQLAMCTREKGTVLSVYPEEFSGSYPDYIYVNGHFDLFAATFCKYEEAENAVVEGVYMNSTMLLCPLSRSVILKKTISYVT